MSLQRPIKVILSESDVTKMESALRGSKLTPKQLADGTLIDGILETIEKEPSGEIGYRFKILNMSDSPESPTKINDALLSVVSPSLENGGVKLLVGHKYRVFAAHLPDGRNGVWRGLVVPE